MKKFPKEIKILNKKCSVKTVDSPCDTTKDGKTSHLGSADGWDNEIRILKGNTNVMYATLFHEIFHVALDTLGAHELSKDEDFVERFSNTFHAILLDNPELKNIK